MSSSLLLFVALALICCATAFPLSALFAGSPFSDPRLFAIQLLSLHDGTYLAIMFSAYSVTQLELNSGVRTVPLPRKILGRTSSVTTIVARLHPANESVIWAYDVSYFDGTVYAVVDDARSIFVVGEGTDEINFESVSGLRLLRFSVDGEATWGEFYTAKALGLPRRLSFLSGANNRVPFAALAGPRTLAILGVARADPTAPGRNAIFIDTITREARLVRFPLPNGPREFVEFGGVAADSTSGAACFSDVTRGDTLRGRISVKKRRLFVQCVNAGGGGEVVSRVLVPFEENTGWDAPHVVMGGGGEGKAAVLYVVTIRNFRPEPTKQVSSHALTDSNKVSDVIEMLLYKLDPATLQNVEWESGLISTKPTMRRLLLTKSISRSGGEVTSLRYIREQNTLAVLYEADTILYGVETLPDGTIVFRGNSSVEAILPLGQQWLLYFGNDPEPAAVRIPDDPRPDGEQDGYDKLVAQDFELSEDGRDLYLFGGLETKGAFRYGELVTVPFPMAEFARPGAGGPEMETDLGDGLEDGVDKSFEPSLDESSEPSPNETAEAMLDEEVEPSPNSLQDCDT